MKKIIVPTDFSPASLNAVYYAAEMALSVNASMILLNVFQIPVTYPEGLLISDVETEQNVIKKDISNIKNELAVKYGNRLIIETELMVGLFYSELKTLCEEIDPYAVIMGSQGTTATERLFFGNHALHVVKHLPWPVITVPVTARFSRISKIGLAWDFGNIRRPIPFDAIKSLVTMFNAELYILYAGKEADMGPDLRIHSTVLTQKLGLVKQEFQFLGDGGVDEAIIDFAEKNSIDLLLILPHRHRFYDFLIHKSHTKKFVLQSHVPVMALQGEQGKTMNQ